MGGGLRQAGVLAAPGIFAIKTLANRIDEDNKNAKYLAEQLELIPEITVNKKQLDINMVFFKLPKTVIENQCFVQKLLQKGIKINGSLYSDEEQYRFVTHYYIDKSVIDYVVSSIKEVIYK